MKKLVLLISIIVLSFSLFLYIFFKPQEYTLKYEINGYKITEQYNKKYKLYYFQVEDDVYTFDFVKNYKYSVDRRLISDIKTDDNCITPFIKGGYTNQLCAFNNENSYYQKLNIENIEEKISTKKDINVYNYQGNIYAIWNYKGLDVLSADQYQKINLFDEDVYNNNLIGLVNEYLILPNYDSGYEYQELIIINLKTGKQSVIKLDNEISSDSYVLGAYKKSLFIVDKKNKVEYEINPYLKKIRVVGNETKNGKIYYLDDFKEVSINKLVNNNLSFEFNAAYNYQVKDNILYLTYFDNKILTKVADFNNGHIIKTDNNEVYYLIGDTLYLYNPIKGNMKLLQKFEWNFNYENKIFIVAN